MDRPSSTLNPQGLSGLHKAALLGHRHTQPTQLLGKQQAAQQLLSLLGVGVAGGVGVRGLMGLRDMVKDTQYPPQSSAQLPQPINLMRNFPAEEEEADVPGAAMQKSAGEPGALAKAIAPMMPKTHTTSPLKNQAGIPMGMLAVGGGAFGGYKLLDWLLDKERGNTGQQEVGAAEDEYRKALAEQYRAAMQAKHAGDDLGITALADLYVEDVQQNGRQKRAIFNFLSRTPIGPMMDQAYAPVIGNDNWEAFKGTSDAAALALALGSGLATYNWTKGSNKNEILAKALKKRQQQRSRLSPAPMVAMTEEEQTADAA